VLPFSGGWHYDPVVFSVLPVSLQLWLVTEASAVLWPFSTYTVDISLSFRDPTSTPNITPTIVPSYKITINYT
jgi:hypothetical protein